MNVKQRFFQGISILLCAIIVAAMTLLAMGLLKPLVFWFFVIGIAFAAFVVLPWLKKQ